MTSQRSMISLFTFLIVAIPLLLSGCAPNAPYHVRGPLEDNCRNDQQWPECSESYYQEHEGFDLAFAEFTDRGNAFNDKYIEDVIGKIKEKAGKDGVVVVTFIHGWKHNAKETDPNLVDFKKALQAVNGIIMVRVFLVHGSSLVCTSAGEERPLPCRGLSSSHSGTERRWLKKWVRAG